MSWFSLLCLFAVSSRTLFVDGQVMTVAPQTNDWGNSSFLHLNPCLYLYFDFLQATIYTAGGTGGPTASQIVTMPQTFTLSSDSTCISNSGNTTYSSNNTIYAHWNYKMPNGNLTSLDIWFYFQQVVGTSYTWWQLVDVGTNFTFETREYSQDGLTITTGRSVDTVQAPLGYSYHCSDDLSIGWWGASGVTSIPSGYNWGSSNATLPIVFYFQGLQVEPYRLNSTQIAFSQANDCEIFVSPMLLGAFLCVAILLAVLAFGLIMNTALQTMDRFDDNKDEKFKAQMALLAQAHKKAD